MDSCNGMSEKKNFLSLIVVMIVILILLAMSIMLTGCTGRVSDKSESEDSAQNDTMLSSYPEYIEVETPLGTVKGAVNGDVFVFKGIPYAKPPVEELRFAPTQPVEPWLGVLDCLDYSAAAPQVGSIEGSNGESEDCLYLNIWAPAAEKNLTDSEAGAPVYVFFHGGSYSKGAGSKPVNDGTYFAEKGIILVTVNYRLNALGFMALEETMKQYGTTGNFGTLDQIQALKWVRDNISAFGGDPKRVTAGGNSAGAFAVSALMISPLADGLFSQAVLESGCILSSPVTSPYNRGDLEKSLDMSRRYAEMFGAEDSSEGLSILRKADADFLAHNAVFSLNFIDPATYSFWPVFDGAVIPKDPLKAVKEGRIAPVKLFAGYNTDEGSLFIDEDITETDYKTSAYLMFGAKKAEKILGKFPATEDHSAAARDRDLVTMSCFRAGMMEYADKLSAMGQDVYLYHYDYMTPTLLKTGLGATHASELPLFFGNAKKLDREGETLSREMHLALVNFIMNGDPNVGFERPSGLLWPKYSQQSQGDQQSEINEANTMLFSTECVIEGVAEMEDLDFIRELMFGSGMIR